MFRYIETNPHVTQYTDIPFVRSATNIFCVSELDEIQLIFDPCWTSWTTQTELASFALVSAADVPLHLPLLRFHRTTLQSSPPDTSMSLGLNLGKCTWDALEECFLRHSSGTNFFFPSNLKSWVLPLPEMEIVVLSEPLHSKNKWKKKTNSKMWWCTRHQQQLNCENKKGILVWHSKCQKKLTLCIITCIHQNDFESTDSTQHPKMV